MTASRIEMPDARPASSRSAAALLAAWRPQDGFLLQRSGMGVAGAGMASCEDLPAGPGQLQSAAAVAERLLGALEGPRRAEAVAVAALPYDGGVASRIFVPSRILRRTSPDALEREAGEVSTLGPEPGPPLLATALPGRPAALTIREEPRSQAYAAAVTEAVRRIGAGELDKVVLARCLLVDGGMLEEAMAIVSRLCEADPDCYTFAAPGLGAGGRSLFVGATPELLVRRSGSTVLSTPLGGSIPRSSDAVSDRRAGQRLLASGKDRREHRLVVEAVTDSLAPFCSDLSVSDEPTLTSTAGMWHLGSTVRGTLRPSSPSALGLAAALHPTPAICGTPRDAALRAIHELEAVPRGLYSGIVGWVDARGDGEWAVAIRCAELTASCARLYAGAGIVEGSNPVDEVTETAGKFSALVDALTG